MNKKNIKSLLLLLLAFSAPNAYAQRSVPENYKKELPISYIRTWDAASPQSDGDVLTTKAVRDARQLTEYHDGLGRNLQTVIREGSLQTGLSTADMIVPFEYDNQGREQYKYLKTPSIAVGINTAVSDGSFRLNPFEQQAAFYQGTTFSGNPIANQGESYFYSKNVYENSPLSRIKEQYAPGNSWMGSESNSNPLLRRSTQQRYFSNTAADQVRIWNCIPGSIFTFGTYSSSGVYGIGQLTKRISIDEDHKQTITFIDKSNKIILKKVQIGNSEDDGTGTGYLGWLCTYSIYDDFENLVCVIQPAAVEEMATTNNWSLTSTSLTEQCFLYAYDSRNRIILKKSPGAAEEEMIYDARDRVVLTQNGNMRTSHQWLYTQYDALNRAVFTGTITDDAHYNDPSYHASLAAGSAAYPDLNNYPVSKILTQTFYDNYDWLAGAGNPFGSNYTTTYDTYFEPVSSTAWPYGQANSQAAAKGLVTGTKVNVVGSANYLYNISYYDIKGRLIQTKATNITGGTDITTTQYTWSGQPLVSVIKQERQGAGAQTTILVSRNTYDDLGRLSKVEKKISNTLVDAGSMTAYKATLAYEYDKLGQLKIKSFSPDQVGPGAALEQEQFDYNIRGWMLGMNRGYAKDQNEDNYFGFDLGYDKISNALIGNATYAMPQYTGNIAGTVWKSRGDAEKRKYDFAYDKANRLVSADFNQFTNNSFNKDAGVDFSVSNLSYDANGNTLSMYQKGLKINTSPFIDKLSYSYFPGSNRLKGVTDLANDNTSTLGDFKYDAGTKTATDYSYDITGNLISDANKKVGSIQYNFFNLPQEITVTGKGVITYVYDANGSKIRKITTDNTVSGKTITSTTDYLGGIVYESKSTMPADANNPDFAGMLTFAPHEEGRIRLKQAEGTSPAKFVFDYFLKDHLGNVRSVITDDVSPAKHYAASFETAVRTYENALFANIDETAYPVSGINMPSLPDCNSCMFFPDAPPAGGVFGSTTPSNEYVSRLNGNGRKIGATLSLKVMAGDKIELGTYVWYPDANATSSTEPDQDAVQTLLSILSNDAAGLSGGAHTAGQLGGSGGLMVPGLMSFLDSHTQPTDDPNDPKTYINWVLFDENLNYVPEGSGFIQAKITSNEVQTLAQTFTLPKSGFFFVYLSNETQHYDVFFDQLVVNHTPSAILEETHYYPFGLVMDGISSKAAGGIQNRNKYNSKELQSKEFNDGSGLEWTNYGARMYDQQLGRWFCIDALAEKSTEESPFSYGGNNPVNFVDEGGYFKMRPSDQKKYSALAGYLKNGIGEILNSKAIMGALKKYGNFTENEIRNKLVKWNSGIGIDILDGSLINGANGYYPGGKGNNIQINKALAQQLQDAKTPEEKQALLLAIVSTILHESVHRGDWDYDGLPNDQFFTYYNEAGYVVAEDNEVGKAFEIAVYHSGNYEENEKSKKLGKEGLISMMSIIKKKEANEEDKKSLPHFIGQGATNFINNAMQVNPNIKLFIH